MHRDTEKDQLLKIHSKKAFNIDIGTRCTLQCSECVRTKWLSLGKKLPGPDMTLEQFDKLSDFFKGRMISFCGTWSDPIYNPHFIDMLKMCKEKNIFPEVHTAASHKPKDWYLKAFEANQRSRWVFGIDGLPEQSHIYRKNQDGEKLFDIMLLCKSMGIETEWQYLIFDYNKSNIKKAENIAKRHRLKLLLIETTRNTSVNIKT